MKRYKDLWKNFSSYENAVNAITKGTRHKRNNRNVVRKLGDGNGGLDPDKVKIMAEYLTETIHQGWHPSPCRHMTIRCNSTGKVREIDCTTLNDHFVIWMLILAIEKPLKRGMYKYSCGSIPGRGIEYARKTIERWTKSSKCKYFVKLDITKFYESVDHDVLKSLFRRVIKDKRILEIIDAVIGMIGKGLPIGSYASQWFANFYLQTIDHFIMQELYKTRRDKRVNYVHFYLRYMDDMLLIGTSKRDLEKAVRAVGVKLHDEFKAEIKNAWEIKSIDEYPVDMIGYRFYRTHTVMRKRIFLRVKRLAKKIYRVKNQTNKIRLHDAQGLVSLIGWANHGDSKEFHKLYIKPYIKIKQVKEVISYESRKQHLADSTIRP